MASQQVRPVIECFCQILSMYGFSPVTPEIFRLAKFDRSEATTVLWRLLFEMLHFDPTTTQQQSSTATFAETPKDELTNTIKSDLFARGYTYENFLALDDNMQEGSRQLLVCVGWLVYHIKLIEKCMEQCLKSVSILDNDDTSALHQTEDDVHVQHPQEKDMFAQVKQAMRLNSKLRFGLRRLHGLITEKTNLQHQIHTYHNMSSLEAYLCQHPHLLSHYLIELEAEHRKLDLFLFWNEHENVFWKWMESVLDQTTPTDVDDEENYEPLRQADYQRLEAEKQRFNAALDTLDNALVRIEQLWISNNHDASMERDVSSLVATIDTQVSSLFNELLASDPSLSLPSTASPNHSLFLNEPRPLVFAQATTSTTDDSRFIKPIDCDRETNHLQTLQSNIDDRVQKQRVSLDTLVQQFEHAMIV